MKDDLISSKKIETSEFKNLLNQLGITEENLQEKISLNTLRNRWKEIVGPVFASHSEVYSIQFGKLRIIVSHNAYKQELLFLQNRILRQSGQFLGRGVVRSLEISIGKLAPSFASSQLEVKEKRGLEGKEDLIAILEKETDPDIKKRYLEILQYL
ncbi:DciA family protein [Leptospira sp. WS92.C1]